MNKCLEITNIMLIVYVLFRDENDVVPKAVNAILQIPSTTHIAVQYSAVLLIGELCEWFDVHPEHLC